MQVFLTFLFNIVTPNALISVIILVSHPISRNHKKENMEKQYNINTLVSKLITGEITEEEGKYLLQKTEDNPALREKIAQLMDEGDFLQRYRLYKEIDADKAKAQFISSVKKTEKNGKQKAAARIVTLRRLAAAAAIALVLIGSWMYFGHQDDPKSTAITTEMHQAIQRVQQNNMNAATFIVNGKKMAVKDAKAVLAQTEQMEDGHSLFGTEDIVEGSLVTKKDKEFWMVLDDGTYVHLNYNTTLIYPNHFTGSERRVKLKGEAYFAVAKDSKKRPFIVETANGDIHDYGTEFNVNTMKEEGITSVVLVKGKVGVSSKYGKEYLLKPGEMATLQQGRTPDINKVDVNLYTSWNTGNFYFDGCTLENLMEVISHWYGMKVEYSSDDIKDMLFTGSIDKYEPMAPTLNAIEHITGLRIAAKDGIVTIRRSE